MAQAHNITNLVTLLFKTLQLIRKHTKPSEKLSLASFVQLHILQFIAVADSKKPINMGDVANYLNITPPSATSLIANLVKNKRLKRVYSTRDRRMVHLELTPQGKQALKNGHAYFTKRMKRVLILLSPKEQNQIIAILQKISNQYVHK